MKPVNPMDYYSLIYNPTAEPTILTKIMRMLGNYRETERIY